MILPIHGKTPPVLKTSDPHPVAKDVANGIGLEVFSSHLSEHLFTIQHKGGKILDQLNIEEKFLEEVRGEGDVKDPLWTRRFVLKDLKKKTALGALDMTNMMRLADFSR